MQWGYRLHALLDWRATGWLSASCVPHRWELQIKKATQILQPRGIFLPFHFLLILVLLNSRFLFPYRSILPHFACRRLPRGLLILNPANKLPKRWNLFFFPYQKEKRSLQQAVLALRRWGRLALRMKLKLFPFFSCYGCMVPLVIFP